jgi:hypothetical protein
VVPGQEHVPQAQLFGLGLKLLKDGRSPCPSLVSFAQLCVEETIGGDTLLLDKLFDLHTHPMLVSIGLNSGGHGDGEKGQLTRSSVFLARSLTSGWTIIGILVEADMVEEKGIG